MEKYYVMVIVNGNLQIKNSDGSNAITEWTDVDKAEGAFHSKCATYANTPEAVDATIIVVDTNFDTVKGMKRHIQHEAKA